ncbi:B12 binding domain protein [compost metagenome]
MFMKICLINPITIYYSMIKDDFVSDSQNTLPYLGLGYLASVLEEAGHEVDIIECTRERLWGDALVEKIKNKRYSMIGLSVFDYNYKNAVKIITAIEKENLDTFVLVGGMYATTNFGDVLKDNTRIDCCVLTEGEITVKELATKLDSKEKIENVKGIAYLNQNEVVVTPPRELIADLDEIPFPKRQFINLGGKIQIKTSRGCEKACLFCATSAVNRACIGDPLRFRSPQNIVTEILACISAYSKVKRIFFIDDSFLSVMPNHEKWLLELCRLLKENHIDIPFDIYARAKGVIKYEGLLDELKECGMSSVFIGIESFLDEQLKFYNKQTTRDENISALNILKKHGIACDIGFIPLDPTVSLEQVIDNYIELKNSATIDIAENFKVFSMHRAVIALNGTPLKRMLVKRNKYVENEQGYLFDDKRVERLFAFTKLWSWKIRAVLSKAYLTEWLRQNDKIELFHETVKANRDFMRLDVDFMIRACHLLKEESTTDDELASIINQYLPRVDLIRERYEKIEERAGSRQSGTEANGISRVSI